MNGSEAGSEDSFGRRLRQYREAAGLTQEQLAERAGLTAKAISALERGERRRPYRHTIESLATALQFTGPGDVGKTRLAQGYDNIRSALGWFWAQQDGQSMARIGWAVWRLWYLRGQPGDGLQWMERALALPIQWNRQARMRALFTMGMMLHERGDLARAAVVQQEGTTIADESDLQERIAVLVGYGFAVLPQGQLAEAQRAFTGALAAPYGKGGRSLDWGTWLRIMAVYRRLTTFSGRRMRDCAVRAQLDPQQLERAWQVGRAMPLVDVVDLAIAGTNNMIAS